MLSCKYLTILSIIFYNFHWIFSCGCYGSRSCTVNHTRCNFPTSDLCVCDCCPPCNTCKQFFKYNCYADQYLKHFGLLSNQTDIIIKRNQPMISRYITNRNTGESIRYLWDPCLRRELPKGINLKYGENGTYELTN